MNIKNLTKKKKILYRLKYRGVKELDMLFEKFSQKFFENLTEQDLHELNELLDIPDLELLDFILEKKTLPSNLDNKTFNRLKNINN
ncbi:MAG: hypothetical protein CMM91_10065 [Rickettsiales bacterium]|nr:hypothetical protein [Rickettsiales bacterium]OUV52824.1 MAG: hypothetical protein CBC87_05550 [Rickettsiales bacterium TMED127]|tara:strand:- start:5086 stop:5343 length:258 start_codon:yes stop_codon:yes gene_type:complete